MNGWKNMKKILIAMLTTTIFLSACTAPTEEEISDAVSKKVEDEVNKMTDKATEEATKKANELIETGTTEIGDLLNSILEEKPSGTSIDTGGSTEQIPVELKSVTDGDTLRVIYDGQEVAIRYLLTDTAETAHPKLGEQPFGQEAKERNKELVESGQLTIEFDVGERMDKYGRLLAYVYVGGLSVQETLLKEGLARVAYVYPPNTRYLTEFERVAEKAKKAKIGIWSIDGYVQDNGFNN